MHSLVTGTQGLCDSRPWKSAYGRLAAAFALVALLSPIAATAQINIVTVDCTPFVSPGPGSFGATLTMGMALQAVDQGSDFNVTELTPAAFRALTAAQLSAFDLIAVNNHPQRLGDGCVVGAGTGLGTTWQSAVGVMTGGRVVLTSHDAPRFKLLRTPPANPLNTGFEPFGTIPLVRQAALWAGGIPGRTGLLIFNDAARFGTVGGAGWNNPELNLPAVWGIIDLDQSGGVFTNGGYTDILPAFQNHPIYDGTAIGGVVLSDVRGAQNTISSFSANIGDTSFHSVFGSFDPTIFTATEVVVNAGVIDVGGICVCAGHAVLGPDGSAITLIREGNLPPDCSAAAPSVDTLWPPNHKMVPISIVGVTDPDGDPIVITVDSIYQDEEVVETGAGAGATAPDGDGVGTATASVRAERNGNRRTPGDGRVYHIGFTADDGFGETCSATVTVCVPHDQSLARATCVDGGALYDSTVP